MMLVQTYSTASLFLGRRSGKVSHDVTKLADLDLSTNNLPYRRLARCSIFLEKKSLRSHERQQCGHTYGIVPRHCIGAVSVRLLWSEEAWNRSL